MLSNSENTPWRILVVDDEEGIHGITRMIFRGYQFENRSIELISAFNGEEARDILRSTSDIALILLDVVMESDDEGLKLIDFVRNTQGNRDIRIILRTGHPGYAPETEVIVDYDINDYLSKAELSASRLLTSVVVALRSYRDIESARQHQQQNTDQQPLESILLNQLGQSLKPLVEDSIKQAGRLKQLGLSPMAQDLVQVLNAHQQRLYNSCLILEDNLQILVQLEVLDVREILDQLVQNLLPQARQQGWLLDYQVDENLPTRVRLAAKAVNQLWMSLTEHALHSCSGSDLKLQLSYNDASQELELTINTLNSDDSGFGSLNRKPVQTSATQWQRFRYQQAEKLCQQLGGELSGSEQGGADQLLCCRLPVEAII
ncbi:MAG: response regulator [Motiliproteus sp.]